MLEQQVEMMLNLAALSSNSHSAYATKVHQLGCCKDSTIIPVHDTLAFWREGGIQMQIMHLAGQLQQFLADLDPVNIRIGSLLLEAKDLLPQHTLPATSQLAGGGNVWVK